MPASGAALPGFVEPDYSGAGPRATLGDVLPAVATALGVDVGFHDTSLALPPAPAYVVVLVDGMGHDLLAEHRAQAPFLHDLLSAGGGVAPATCGVPSTTATSLTSLGTALTPGTHGLVGFTSRVPQTGELLNSLFWDREVDPLEWQPHPTAFARLEAAGVRTTVVSKREFAGSGLTRCGQRGAAYAGADDVVERIAAAVEASRERPSVTYVYDGDLDWHGHRAGVDSSAGARSCATSTRTSRSCARSCPTRCAWSWSPTTGWSTRVPRPTSTSTRSPACATG